MNRQIGLVALLALPAVALAGFSAQDKKAPEKGPPADMQGMMPQPGPHHARIKDFEGTWDCDVQSFMAPEGMPATSKAVEVDRPVGGFWNVMDATGSFGGMAFQGHGTSGYDSKKKKHVGTWIDNFGDYIMLSEGDCDGTCKVETTYSESPDMMGGPGMVKVKNVHTWVDKDNRTYEMFMQGEGGKWNPWIKITYKRRK
ncbi:MAG: DUF1579 domain-containing protein [Planctomycetes bacterium]|nr:DUF1579 domain-containing protein [Planctomycetota bacterium]